MLKFNLTLFKLLYTYNPETGLFTTNCSSTFYKQHQIVGNLQQNGYINLKFEGRNYPIHRLAWIYMTGKWPKEFIDHIDQDKCNNKWNNLREATRNQNGFNRGKQINNTTGIKGLVFYKNDYSYGRPRYKAQIAVNGKKYSKSISVSKERSEKDIIEELTLWLKQTRKKLCGEFSYDD